MEKNINAEFNKLYKFYKEIWKMIYAKKSLGQII